MGRKRKIVTEADGTPVEVEPSAEEVAAEAAAQAEADAELSEVTLYGVAGPRTVIWTELAERDGVFSEFGQHKAGDEVLTRHAATLIANGYATEKA